MFGGPLSGRRDPAANRCRGVNGSQPTPHLLPKIRRCPVRGGGSHGGSAVAKHRRLVTAAGAAEAGLRGRRQAPREPRAPDQSARDAQQRGPCRARRRPRTRSAGFALQRSLGKGKRAAGAQRRAVAPPPEETSQEVRLPGCPSRGCEGWRWCPLSALFP